MKLKLLIKIPSIQSIAKALALSALILTCSFNVQAQDVHFNYSSIGETKAMTHWGVDTAWPSPDNVRQSIYHMGIDQVDVVRLNFFTDEALDANGELGPNSKARIDTQLELAALAGNKPLALLPSSEDGTAAYYLDSNGIAIPQRWLALMEATQAYINKPIHAIEVFNEPDYWDGMGPQATFREIIVLVKNSAHFIGTELHAASTLCSCEAQSWYDSVSDLVSHGTTHALSGSADNYINFIGHVINQGDKAYNPELHSMAEVLYGAEYGMEGGIWWGAALHARGILVNAVQGSRLGYAENRGNSSAAAVYRSPNNEVYGFAGSFERHGPKHSYRFIADDQDVYFNGIGPLREFMMPTWADQQGGYINIDTNPNIPALDGHRWQIVNKATGEVLEVSSAGTSDGDDIVTATNAGAIHQAWDIKRTRDGYYTLTNANSGITAEVADWSTVESSNVRQWGAGDNILQHWWIESTGDGYFYLHNGHSDLYMQYDSSNDNVIQADFTGANAQQWSFVSIDATNTGTMIAKYKFDNNANDETSNNNATVSGSPSYSTGNVGQTIELDGNDDYIELPDDVGNSENITIATWVYWDGGDNWQRIFDFGVDTDSYMFLTPSSNAGTMKFVITTGSYSEEQSLVTSVLPTDQWVHVAITLGGNTAILYINGQTQVAGHIFADPTELYAAGGSQNNYIGKSQWQSDALFNGSIDDFRIYNYALDATEINEIYNPTP
ncbi:MAG: RICIN domain-containing protein [Colwellia sp.]